VVVGALLAVVLSGSVGAVSRPPSQPPLLTFFPPLPRPTGQLGIASWYGPGFHGNPTASGELYNQYALTAAHPTLPFGTPVEVINLTNGKSVRVRITDRGPFVRGRAIDLSHRAAQRLGMVQAGISRVRIKPLVASHQSRTRRSSPHRPQRRLSLRTREAHHPQPQNPHLTRVVGLQRKEGEGTVF
jgi:rare lipoprotein A (peptidoglycan hydrolase)